MAGLLKLACVVVTCIVLLGAPMAQAITCGQVSSSLAPCINYLRNGGVPTSPCCSGVRALNSAAKTTADRQAACNCLKSAAGSIPGIKDNFAQALPGACKVNIPYKISTRTNCATIKF